MRNLLLLAGLIVLMTMPVCKSECEQAAEQLCEHAVTPPTDPGTTEYKKCVAELFYRCADDNQPDG